MKKLTFNDVLIKPRFSTISSRADCNPSITINEKKYDVPIMVSNMDTVSSVEMSNAANDAGGMTCLHRFMSIEDNMKMFESVARRDRVFVSVGVGQKELERAKVLIQCGANQIIIDVAHGASLQVAQQLDAIKEYNPDVWVAIGNFATTESYRTFLTYARTKPDALKLGVGSGSICSTRLVTGVGYPQLSVIQEFSNMFPGHTLIADGGFSTSGDLMKAYVAGATICMSGSMFAGCTETPNNELYSGSASKRSYDVQGKTATHRAPEGVTFTVKPKGSVKDVLQELKAGIQSGMSYINARYFDEIREYGEFVEITQNGVIESGVQNKGV